MRLFPVNEGRQVVLDALDFGEEASHRRLADIGFEVVAGEVCCAGLLEEDDIMEEVAQRLLVDEDRELPRRYHLWDVSGGGSRTFRDLRPQ